MSVVGFPPASAVPRPVFARPPLSQMLLDLLDETFEDINYRRMCVLGFVHPVTPEPTADDDMDEDDDEDD